MLKQFIFIFFLVSVACSGKNVKANTKKPKAPEIQSNLIKEKPLPVNLNLIFLKNNLEEHVYTVIKVADGDTANLKNKTDNKLVKIRFA
jgi:hypothetical protein